MYEYVFVHVCVCVYIYTYMYIGLRSPHSAELLSAPVPHAMAAMRNAARPEPGEDYRAVHLTQDIMTSAVMKLASAQGMISLRGLRLALQDKVCINLEGRKEEIRHKTEKAVEDLTMGLPMQLHPSRTELVRNPYHGVWEPCGAVPETRNTRGRLLFTDLHDCRPVESLKRWQAAPFGKSDDKGRMFPDCTLQLRGASVLETEICSGMLTWVQVFSLMGLKRFLGAMVWAFTACRLLRFYELANATVAESLATARLHSHKGLLIQSCFRDIMFDPGGVMQRFCPGRIQVPDTFNILHAIGQLR